MPRPPSVKRLSSLLRHRAQVVVTSDVVTPPLRERNRRSTRTKDCERQDEQAGHTRAIECACNQIRIVLEDAWSIVAEVELRVESDNDPAKQHARLRLVVGEVAGVLNELGEVDLVDREFANLWYELEGH